MTELLQVTAEQRMSDLGKSFGLRLPGLEPWNPVKLASAIGVLSSGEVHVALFLLTVWNHHDGEQFNVHHALMEWDDERRQAFLAWARRPWWA